MLNAAQEANRKVAYVGRSMVRNMKLAEDLGYLKVPTGLVVDYKDLDSFGDKVVLICTGSQGEPLAALFLLQMEIMKSRWEKVTQLYWLLH